MARITFDSCFLIDLERERAGRKTKGSPSKFLRDNLESELLISPIALGEFAIGFEDPLHPVLLKFMENFSLLPSGAQVSIIYARLFRELSKIRSMIGGNDLWIAAYSISNGLPLVTNNLREFSRIEGLELIEY
jgi:tRNA(fMet)-specific endonuclease VapC